MTNITKRLSEIFIQLPFGSGAASGGCEETEGGGKEAPENG